MEEKVIEDIQTACLRCGVCCQNGGPALHHQDRKLIETRKLLIKDLITIRKGELAHNPLVDKVTPTTKELVKIKGSGKEWCCKYYLEKGKGCAIYGNRPYSCGVLECWNPEKSLQLIEKDTLCRNDIIAANDPFREIIIAYDKECPVPDFLEVQKNHVTLQQDQKNCLQRLIRKDLSIRDRMVKNHQISLDEELFYFGRPLFQQLQPFGVHVAERAGEIVVSWK